MKDGKIVEDARIEQFLAGPAHPYSRQLLDSVPRLDVKPRRLTGANDARV
jgi:ABC-type dipeptide/oligopeptide/nickel transport system ATPase component